MTSVMYGFGQMRLNGFGTDLPRRLAAALSALLLLVSVQVSQTAAAVPNDIDENASYIDGPVGERIAEYVATTATVSGFSGAVLAARDGRVMAAVATGHADFADGTPNTPA
ncbi:MAG: hypothetical protein ACOC0P_06965, partial [Planctomycetota bacterium]